MNTWTGDEKVTCFCGQPASIMRKEEGSYLFCFAHSWGAGLMAPIPEEKPEDWSEIYDTKKLFELVQKKAMDALSPIHESNPWAVVYRELERRHRVVERKWNRDADDDLEEEYAFNAIEALEILMADPLKTYIYANPGPIPETVLEQVRAREAP